jgi:hypothetical protein
VAEATDQDKDPSEGEFGRPIPPASSEPTTTPKTAPLTEKEIFDFLGKSYGDVQKSQEREMQLREQHAPEIAARRAEYEAEVKKQQAQPAPIPEIPQAPPVPTREQYIDQTAAKSLFAVASLIGALGMLGGRGRGMLAMAGLTGAIRGFRENNAEKYKAGMEQYHAQVDQQTKAYDEAYKRYLAILQANRLTLDEKIQMYDLATRSMQDDVGMEIAGRKNIGEMIKHATEIGKMSAEMRKIDAEANLFPYKLQEQQLKVMQEKLALQKTEAEIEKLKQTGTKGDTNARVAANELVTRLQAQRKELGKDILAGNKWFSGVTNEKLQEMKDQQADLDTRIENALKDLESYTGGTAAAPGTPKPKAGGANPNNPPAGMMTIRNKKTGEVVFYPTGETPDGWSRIH